MENEQTSDLEFENEKKLTAEEDDEQSKCSDQDNMKGFGNNLDDPFSHSENKSSKQKINSQNTEHPLFPNSNFGNPLEGDWDGYGGLSKNPKLFNQNISSSWQNSSGYYPNGETPTKKNGVASNLSSEESEEDENVHDEVARQEAADALEKRMIDKNHHYSILLLFSTLTVLFSGLIVWIFHRESSNQENIYKSKK